nr:unnamed protein product [Callosobruchus chinensis]
MEWSPEGDNMTSATLIAERIKNNPQSSHDSLSDDDDFPMSCSNGGSSKRGREKDLHEQSREVATAKCEWAFAELRKLDNLPIQRHSTFIPSVHSLRTRARVRRNVHSFPYVTGTLTIC